MLPRVLAVMGISEYVGLENDSGNCCVGVFAGRLSLEAIFAGVRAEQNQYTHILLFCLTGKS